MSQTPPKAPTAELKITDAKLRSMLAASTLGPTERATLACMCDAVNRRTLEIRIGMDRLAALLGVQRRAAVLRVRALEATGVIVPTRTGGGRAENGRGYLNAWTLDLARLRGDRDERPRAPSGAARAEPIPVDPPRQPCSEPAARAQPVAQDSMVPKVSMKKLEAAAPPAAEGVGASAEAEACRPWINPESHPDERANAARQKLRMMLEDLKKRDAAAAGAEPPPNSNIYRTLGPAIYAKVMAPPKPRQPPKPWYQWLTSSQPPE